MKNSYINSIDRVFEVYQNEISNIEKNSFPYKTWQALGKEGLLGLNIPKEFLGKEEKASIVINVGRKLIERGIPIGLALSWLTHLGTQRFLIFNNANYQVKNRILNETTLGKKTVSIAYGEPGFSGKPEDLITYCKSRNDNVEINGVKTYITNGAIADYYVVFAKTNNEAANREVSAYIVPKDIEGVKIIEKIEVKGLEPSSHCIIEFSKCIVKKEYLVGEVGKAYNSILKPMRDFEDAYMVGPFLGGFNRLIEGVAQYIKKDSDTDSKQFYDNLGQVKIYITILEQLSEKISKDLDEGGDLVQSVTAFKIVSRQCLTSIREIIEKLEISEDNDVIKLFKSIDMLMGIGKNVIYAKLKNIGKQVLKESN